MQIRTFFVALLASVSVRAAEPGKPTIQYTRDILPLLSDRCLRCHGFDAKQRRGDLRLDVRTEALKGGKSGEKAIVPGDPTKSEAIRRIFAEESSEIMPPGSSKKSLTAPEKELLKRWVAEGAKYEQHWAFVVPRRPAVPVTTGQKAEIRNAIDAFLAEKRQAAGLEAAQEADRYTLARRVALDLTGLPPTIAEVDRFVHDPSPDAYERYVERVLSSPGYGEHWGSLWMDLGRYADSNGYAQDGMRTIWPWRDWLIHALNRNLPFDQFTIEQFAGDMLPSPTQEQLIATGFHRNTLTNEEGGTSDEEFRVAAVVDRVNTTFQVWMGLTMGCAQCHTHKYDPITQEEYYKVFALLNQTEDADRGDNAPNLPLALPHDERRKKQNAEKLTVLEKQIAQPDAKLDAAQQNWEMTVKKVTLPAGIQAILKLPLASRSDLNKAELTRYFRSVAPETKALRDQIAAIKKELAGPTVMTPIMRELPAASRRKTHILIRGNFLDKGAEVKPGVPAVLPAIQSARPHAAPDRLDFARWVVSAENPLTARVLVNRYWEQVFGIGLVETVEDFGIRGKAPSHPELLDWLAVEFRESGWDVKRLLNLMVTSAAYRQSSRVTPLLLERDPGNRLLARGPRFRASAEVVRDQALAIAGLLSPKMYGPSVRPPRPKLGLNAAFGGSTDWDPSPGEDRYRRGLYTTIRRTAPFPSMTTFDAPDRNFCTLTRPRTNTPLQALVTLNDPVYVEAAQSLARRVVAEGGKNVEERAVYGFRVVLSRPPRDGELRKLTDLFDRTKKRFAADEKAALPLATEPLGPAPKDVPIPELAAWTVISNVLLNLDEAIAKR